MGLRKLGIGTYVEVTPSKPETLESGRPVYDPIATASLYSPVFDVVHMFSQRGISAVPIIDEEGVVVNLYETVDVIVSFLCISLPMQKFTLPSDPCTAGGIPIIRSHNLRGAQSTLRRLPRRGYLHGVRLRWHTASAHPETSSPPLGSRGGRGMMVLTHNCDVLNSVTGRREERGEARPPPGSDHS